MHTELITLDPQQLNMSAVRKAADCLRDGGLVVFPTETVYGLGANATDAAAAQKIYAAKGRPSDNPLIIHVSRPEEAEAYAITSETYYRLARAFMPGPLTVILPKKDSIPSSVTGGLQSVAVRCPSHPIATALISALGRPIAAPSANISGSPSPTSAAHVLHDLDGRVDMILDGGECEIGLESTIVKLEGDKAILLRPGAITYDALCCVCSRVEISPAVIESLKENEVALSPGMKYRHYAPHIPLVLLSGRDERVLAFLQEQQKTTSCTILCYEEELPYLAPHDLICVGKRDDLATQAKRLFAALREADRGSTTIIYAHLPVAEGLGLALYNRMIRAAAHTTLSV